MFVFYPHRGHAYWFLERGKGGRERERNSNWLPLVLTPNPTGDQTYNLGTCHDPESNLRPSGLWEGAPTDCREVGSGVGSLCMAGQWRGGHLLFTSHLKMPVGHFPSPWRQSCSASCLPPVIVGWCWGQAEREDSTSSSPPSSAPPHRAHPCP